MAMIDLTTKTGLTISSADVADIVNHLQGASAKTDAWHFRSSAGNNFLITLSDNAAARKFSIRDSDGVEIFSVDSDGAVAITSLTPTTLNLPTSASPSQTAEGRIVWDSDDNLITVGDGSSRQTFYPDSRMKLIANVATPTSTTSTTAVDLVTISTDVYGAALNIPVTAGVLIIFTYRKQALSANAAAAGLKINSTVVQEAAAAIGTCVGLTSAVNQAEDGFSIIDIAPRNSANYPGGYIATTACRASATGASAVAGAFAGNNALTNPIPNVAITGITLRGINNVASNAFEINSVQVWQRG